MDGLADCQDPDCATSTQEGGYDCTWYYQDQDGDGYGWSATAKKCLCSAGAVQYYTATMVGDCDDADCDTSPGAIEHCYDGRDNDCDGVLDCQDASCEGQVCDDGRFCTTGDTCSGGVCGGAPRNCDLGDPCMIYTCNEDIDSCVQAAKPMGTQCGPTLCYLCDGQAQCVYNPGGC
jgi:hypothetical protein